MKLSGSKTGEFSRKDITNIGFLALMFLGGFYLANLEAVNEFIGHYVSPDKLGVITLFLAYAFKELLQNNAKPKEPTEETK